ncbi:TPA: ATP-binding cassette domain-containing protein [Legionella pneumophila subsp. pneumophila]|uniref:ABC transporter domain-containing protein n=1 Tax=Legionella pneumophila (strain Lens) TaxID=297245 RepID=Q5WYP0_LEGPL|nr:ATP-binding cassette domain-containing protein [Legionella pneumophila]AOW52658.1 multidrug ABC transporter ATP-binding protein [Legionella pneumophila subsp. pneumophila]AOW56439.1 multidrug ABC transporter ATP-binding protein [Legionella pneumophila subsp. pneumophila]AOW63457.1 multidrug ABC transporter ATP-binding protein [Legionella pneumophila subsp. pneumophila]RYW83566.1 ABC transporter ATP-binding protein [Legionella pneumophila]RYW88044.1 ABC transporter ATP-binding protein [Legio
MNSSKPLVSINGVSKCFPGNTDPALDNVSATIFEGQITGLVGPDGAGKSTLMRLICSLMMPTQGTITVDSLNTRTDSEKIHAITGYMPQKFGLYEDLTIIENLRLYAELRNLHGEKREEQFRTLLKFTALEPFQKRLAGNLSGGMKQKLGLACALMGEPKLLLLDEPSVGVDPISRRELWTMVQGLLGRGMGVVWSTAYLDEAEKCDQILLLNAGKPIYHGKPGDFLQKTKDRTFQICGVSLLNRRQALMNALNTPEVIDGVIQGKNIRIVISDKKIKPSLDGITREPGVHFQEVESRFEDAFIDSLKTKISGRSLLAEHIAEKPHSDKPIIEARKLTKRFGNFTAVSNNEFTIKRGEIFGLLGPNGAGKSTTFKMMCGLLQPTQGQAFVMGLDLKTSSSEARSCIGYMAQKFSLYSHLDALQNMRFFSGLYGLSGKRQEAQINSMIEIFDLKKHLKQNSGDLPLGFKQRLALACAVMHEPDVLFLDEPTSGVDPLTRREFWTHINGMVNKGVTVMVTTHFMDEAEYCDRIALIYRGKNIATGTPDDLKDKVRNSTLPNPTLEDAFIELIRLDELREPVH